MIKVIATDLDGTLLNAKNKRALVDKENKQFIQNFYGDIVLVTGRNPKFCAKVCNCLKIQHNFVALNGGIIVKNGSIIYSQSMKKIILSNLLKYLNDNYTNFEFIIFDKYDDITIYTAYDKKETKKKYKKLHHKNGKLQDKMRIDNDLVNIYLNETNIEIYKALIYADFNMEDVGNHLKEKYGDHFSFIVSEKSIEICPKGVNKGDGLQYLISTTKVKNNEVFVVGDSINDIPMFEKFNNSFFINSGNTAVKVKAKHVLNKFSELSSFTKMNDNFL